MTELLEPCECSAFSAPRDTEKSLNLLVGILTGIAIDRQINQKEVDELQNWCSVNVYLNKKEPYKSIVQTVLSAIDDEILTQDEVDDIVWQCDKVNKYLYDDITAGLQTLGGLFHGVLADGSINDTEIRQLLDWINDNTYLKSTYPYDEVESILCSVVIDGKITEEERRSVMGYIGQFIDASTSLNVNKPDIDRLAKDYSISGICSIDPLVEFKDKLFCFTGASAKATRKGFAEVIAQAGGRFSNVVSCDTDYLIVGNDGSPSWAYSCHGRKIEAAMLSRQCGHKIVIVNEVDFWDSIPNHK